MRNSIINVGQERNQFLNNKKWIANKVEVGLAENFRTAQKNNNNSIANNYSFHHSLRTMVIGTVVEMTKVI